MSPVRGKGWYKRPYKVTYTDPRTARRRTLSFHWQGARDRWYEQHQFHYPDVVKWSRVAA